MRGKREKKENCAFILQNRVDKLYSDILHTNQIKFKFKKEYS